jgi:hypothetical protein
MTKFSLKFGQAPRFTLRPGVVTALALSGGFGFGGSVVLPGPQNIAASEGFGFGGSVGEIGNGFVLAPSGGFGFGGSVEFGSASSPGVPGAIVGGQSVPGA